jgi:hypothetical protein
LVNNPDAGLGFGWADHRSAVVVTDLVGHHQHPGGEIQIAPSQPDHLAPAQAEERDQVVERVQRMHPDLVQELRGLLGGPPAPRNRPVSGAVQPQRLYTRP